MGLLLAGSLADGRIATAQTLDPATTFQLATPVSGSIDSATDVDNFEFTLTESTRFVIYTTGDVELEGSLLNSSGTSLREGYPAPPITTENNVFLWHVLGAGTYRVQIAGKNDDTGAYTLNSKVIPLAATFGDAVEVELDSTTPSIVHPTAADWVYFKLVLDSAADVLIRSESLRRLDPKAENSFDTVGTLYDDQDPPQEVANNDDGYLVDALQFAIREQLAAGTHYIRVRGWGFRDGNTGPFVLHVEEVDEPGSSLAAAATLEVGGSAAGRISTESDEDFFRVEVSEKSHVVFAAVKDTGGLRIRLLDSGGSSLGGAALRYVTFIDRLTVLETSRTLSAGTYYLQVDTAGFDADSGEEGTGGYAVAAFESASYARLLEECGEPPTGIDDPLFRCQWNLDNDGQLGATAGVDLNVTDAWDDSDGTSADGSGTVVAVVDSGVVGTHEDLAANFDAAGSHDYLSEGDPGYSSTHGTAVAGLVAAAANEFGGRGVAYGAQLRDINFLQDSTIENEAHAMAHLAASTTVSNNSWGIPDNVGHGRATRLWELAVEQGLSVGDAGRGTFYAWAGGNGGDDDDTNLDELTNFYGVTAVCAVNARGKASGYSEAGANLWVCAPSNDGGNPALFTTAVPSRYTDNFGGTSGAAPQVAGVAALMRDINPALTWRDLKLILASTAVRNDTNHAGWETGAATYEDSSESYEFNHQFGFGLVDANAAVELAETWTNVPGMVTETGQSSADAVTIPDNRSTVSQSVSIGTEVGFVEFVEINVVLDAEKFRDLQMDLVSPSGAVSELMVPYTGTRSYAGLDAADGSIRLGTARHLGENPAGEWTLRISDRNSGGETSELIGWSMTVYGHTSTPTRPVITGLDGATDPTALAVTWQAPADEGSSAVTGYDVRHIRNDSTDKDSDSAWTLVEDAAGSSARSYAIASLSTGVDYDVQVRAYNDAGDGTWSHTATGSLGELLNAPQFPSTETGERSVVEQSPPGTAVGAPVSATDADGDTLDYRLEGRDAASFDINAATGQITTRSALDYEVRQGFVATVVVDDGTGLSDRIDVEIEVTDIDEPPTVVGLSELFVTENLPRFAHWIYRAEDPEGDELTWSVGGTDGHLFEIDDEDLSFFILLFFGPYVNLQFISEPDFEDPQDDDGDNFYDVTVEASDGTNITPLEVIVEVIDTDEPPDLSGDSQIFVSENSTGDLASYDAVDPEGDRIRWSLRGPDQGAFRLVGGVLSFRQPPDYEDPADVRSATSVADDNVYEIAVWASDDTIASELEVEVTVLDVDEPGTVTLSSRQPVVNTAIDAALSDPDGSITGESWVWQGSPNGTSGWSTISGANASSYTPTAGDVGDFLRAVATYTDGNGAGKTATSLATVATGAEPVNKLPSFDAVRPVARVIAENSGAGANVGAPIAATDPDGDALTYTLGGTDASSFEVVAATGQLQTKADLDFETGAAYTVTVSVSDGADDDGNPDTSIDDTVTVNITVTDVNEAPEFTDPIDPLTGNIGVTYSQDENHNRQLARFIARDPENRTLRFFLSGTDADAFGINENGVLTFTSPPDHETPTDSNGDNEYRLRVSVSDHVHTVFKDITVTVVNVNEPPTVAPQSLVHVENDTAAVFAYDSNDPDSDSVDWSVGGVDGGSFAIDENGVLTFKSPPDYEAPTDSNGDNDYYVDITADDGEFRSTETTQVTVVGVDEPPVFTSAPTPVSVIEGFDGVIARYEGEDPEGVDLAWTLVSTDFGDLTIDQNGDLRFKSIPDFENPADANQDNSYSVQVVARDGNHLVREWVEINVTNVDEDGSISFLSSQPQENADFTAVLSDIDGDVRDVTWSWEHSAKNSRNGWTAISGADSATYTPAADDVDRWLRVTADYTDNEGPGKEETAESSQSTRQAPQMNRAPDFPSSETGARSVAENTAAGADIGAPFSADDDDGDALTYALGGADAGAFSLDGSSGQLRTKDPLDHETKSTYRLMVTATDPSLATDTLNVTVTVTDVNEAPELSGPDAVNFAENGTGEVAGFGAVDPERRALVWSLGGDDDGRFTIDGGSLRFRQAPDVEMPADADGGNDYEVIVEVTDDVGNVTMLPVKVTVTAVDEPPILAGPDRVDHPENTVVVGSYNARDPEGSVVRWSLGGDDAGALVISAGGELSFAQTPDYELPADRNRDRRYQVTVIASDGLLSSQLPVTVALQNYDDVGAVTFSSDEPAAGTALVATLSDPDGGVTNVEWTWHSSLDRNDWTGIEGATTNRYTPTESDVGVWLRASVTYDDRHGPGKAQQAVAANAVAEAPATQRVTTVVGPGGGGTFGGSVGGGGGGGAGGGGGGGDFDVGFATFVVANGWSPADVGVASVLAARTDGAVVLYTAGDELSEPTRLLLREALPAEVFIVGGTAAVSREVRSQIRAASSDSGISRVAGAGRAETAAGVARSILGSPGGAGRVTLVVANGWSPPDIGAAAALAARSGRAAVAYTERGRLPEASAALLRDYNVARVILVGGTAAISAEVAEAIAHAAGGASVTRLTGTDRIDTAAQAARRVLGNPVGAPDGITLVIANGWSPPDVGVAAALAAATDNAAVAYTAQGALPDATAALVADYRVGQVIIVGGRSAVANDVRIAVAATALPDTDIRRITGQTRTDTAARAARRILAAN